MRIPHIRLSVKISHGDTDTADEPAHEQQNVAPPALTTRQSGVSQDRRQDAPIRSSFVMLGGMHSSQFEIFAGNHDLLTELEAEEAVSSMTKKNFHRGQTESPEDIAHRRESRLLTAQSPNAGFSGAGSSAAFSGAGSSAAGLSAAGSSVAGLSAAGSSAAGFSVAKSSAAGSAARSQHSYAASTSIVSATESVECVNSTQSHRTPKVRKKRKDAEERESKSFGKFGAEYGGIMTKESQAKALKELKQIEGGGKGELGPGKKAAKYFRQFC